MSKEFEFLKGCGVFFVLTVNGDKPAGRPFGAVMELNNTLYISTGDMKNVYAQLKANANIQLMAIKPGTRNWIRISGKAVECDDAGIRTAMLECCPVLKKHFPDANAPHFAVFGIDVVDSEIF